MFGVTVITPSMRHDVRAKSLATVSVTFYVKARVSRVDNSQLNCSLITVLLNHPLGRRRYKARRRYVLFTLFRGRIIRAKAIYPHAVSVRGSRNPAGGPREDYCLLVAARRCNELVTVQIQPRLPPTRSEDGRCGVFLPKTLPKLFPRRLHGPSPRAPLFLCLLKRAPILTMRRVNAALILVQTTVMLRGNITQARSHHRQIISADFTLLKFRRGTHIRQIRRDKPLYII